MGQTIPCVAEQVKSLICLGLSCHGSPPEWAPRMVAMPKPSEVVPFVLKYEGPEVDDGSMSIEDIVPVLQGFASAYGKIASEQGVGVQHRIRITGVERGSA